MKRVDLLQFSLLVLALGVSVGLLCHYVDHGWNAGTPTVAKFIVIGGTILLFLIILLQFFSLTRAPEQEKSVNQSGTEEL